MGNGYRRIPLPFFFTKDWFVSSCSDDPYSFMTAEMVSVHHRVHLNLDLSCINHPPKFLNPYILSCPTLLFSSTQKHPQTKV